MVTDNLQEEISEQEKKEFNLKFIPYYKFIRECSLFQDTINKFQVFDLIEYDKVFFLDADIFIKENIDYIFDLLKDVEFFAEKDEINKRYGGGAVLFTPEAGKFQTFLNEYDKEKIYTDELGLIGYFYPNYTGHKEIWKDLSKKLFHDGGIPKYWCLFDEKNNIQTLSSILDNIFK